MTTPLLMLALMTAPALFVLLHGRAVGRRPELRPAAATGLALLFAFTASGHFVQAEAMAQMLPPWVPARDFLVLVTGMLEVAIATAFLVPRWRRHAGWVAAAVLVAFFPANVYAAIERVPMGGHAWGPVYLWLRAPLQIAILAWVAWFTIRIPAKETTESRPMRRRADGRPQAAAPAAETDRVDIPIHEREAAPCH